MTKTVRTDSGSEASLTISSECIDRKMKLYLERPAVNPDSDSLIWWLSERKKLPVIVELAQSICVHVEQVFHQNAYSARLDLLSTAH